MYLTLLSKWIRNMIFCIAFVGFIMQCITLPPGKILSIFANPKSATS